MNYIVMDLEWNRALSKNRIIREPIKLGGEVIQIGAVKLDENFNVLGTYSEIIKPVYYTKMFKEVTQLTDITDEIISDGRPFTEVCQEFLDWCGNEYAFVTWSENDIYMLEDNMYIHGMDYRILPECYDLQVMFDDQITQADRNFALSYAMWKLEIKPNMSHDALNDALNTVEVMNKLDLSEGFEGYEVGLFEEDETDIGGQ